MARKISRSERSGRYRGAPSTKKKSSSGSSGGGSSGGSSSKNPAIEANKAAWEKSGKEIPTTIDTSKVVHEKSGENKSGKEASTNVAEWNKEKDNKNGTATWKKTEVIDGKKQTRVISNIPTGYKPTDSMGTKQHKTFTSKDSSKPYFGMQVYKNPHTGRITPVHRKDRIIAEKAVKIMKQQRGLVDYKTRQRAVQLAKVQISQNKKGTRTKFTPSNATIRAAPKRERPKNLGGASKRLAAITEKQRQKMKAAGSGPKGSGERMFRGIAVLGTLGLLRGSVGVIRAIMRPDKAIKNMIIAAKHPLRTIECGLHEFAIDPVGTTVEYATFSRTLNLVSKGAKRSPVGRTVQEEIFIRVQPKEIRPAVRAIIKSSKVQEAINPFKIKSLRKIDFAEIKSLTKTEAKALGRTLRQTDSVIFGSAASRTLSKKKTAIPKDVDIATADISKFNKKFIQNVPKSQKRNYISKGEKLIRKSNKEALFDIKPIQRLIPDKSILTRRGYLPVSGYVRVLKYPKRSILPRLKKKAISGALEVPTQKIQRVGGVKLVGFGEQTLRKGLGTLQVLIEKNIRRAKDPQAFVKSLQIQMYEILKSKPKTAIGRTIKKSKIKKLDTAIKLLTSKKFQKLLENKVPGITKEFPILRKINIKKLKKTRKVPNNKIKRISTKLKKKTLPRIPKKSIKKIRSNKKRNAPIRKKYKNKVFKRTKSKTPSKMTKKSMSTTIKYLSKPPSKLPSKPAIASKLPQKLKSKSPSKIPSKKKSKIPSRIPSKAPSKIPSKKKSKIPSRIPSKTPSKFPSRIPSNTPSKVPSKIPSRIPSKPSKKIPAIRSKKPLISKGKRKKKNIGYDVLVKKAGAKSRYEKINQGALRESNAINLGRFITDNSPMASFKIRPSNRKITQKFTKATSANKFRRRKGKTKLPLKTRVERKKHRLDTKGEKVGITLKGLRQLKSQKSIIKRIKRFPLKGTKRTKGKQAVKRRVSPTKSEVRLVKPSKKKSKYTVSVVRLGRKIRGKTKNFKLKRRADQYAKMLSRKYKGKVKIS